VGRSGPLRNRKTNVETAKRPGWVPSSVLLEGLNVLWDAFYLSWPYSTEYSTSRVWKRSKKRLQGFAVERDDRWGKLKGAFTMSSQGMIREAPSQSRGIAILGLDSLPFTLSNRYAATKHLARRNAARLRLMQGWYSYPITLPGCL